MIGHTESGYGFAYAAYVFLSKSRSRLWKETGLTWFACFGAKNGNGRFNCPHPHWITRPRQYMHVCSMCGEMSPYEVTP